MIRTVVCEKEGCSGNTFFIETQGNNLVLTCEHCKSKYEFDIVIMILLYYQIVLNVIMILLRYLGILKRKEYMQNVLNAVQHQKRYI